MKNEKDLNKIYESVIEIYEEETEYYDCECAVTKHAYKNIPITLNSDKYGEQDYSIEIHYCSDCGQFFDVDYNFKIN